MVCLSVLQKHLNEYECLMGGRGGIMQRVIIGQNGSGKTRYLREQIDKRLRSEGALQIVTNVRGIHGLDMESIPMSQDRVDLLDSISINCDVECSGTFLNFVNCQLQYSDKLIQMLTLLCRDAKYCYLDMPDFLLYSMEKVYLLDFLCRIARTYEEFILVTYEPTYIDVMGLPIYVMRNSQLMPLGEFKGGAYALRHQI